MKCPECGSPRSYVKGGYLSCTDCKWIDDIPQMMPSSSTYNRDGVTIKKRGSPTRINSVIRRWERRLIPKEERNVRTMEMEIHNTIERLGLESKPLKKIIREEYKRAVSLGLARRCGNKPLLGAIIYMECKLQKDPRFFRFPSQISEVLEIKEKSPRRAIKIVRETKYRKVNIPAPVKGYQHVRTFYEVLETIEKRNSIDNQTRQLARYLFEKSTAPIKSYKSAKARAAAAIYEAAKFYGIRVKEQELAKVLEINRGMIIRERKKL